MNLTQAIAPLKEGEGRLSFEAGAWVRGDIRRAMITLMVDFYEDRSMIDSSFIARGPANRVVALQKYLQRLA